MSESGPENPEEALARCEEEALIRSFFVAAKRERFIGFLANPKRRGKATAALDHLGDLDPRYVVRIPGNQHHAGLIEQALRARGAGDTCHVISSSSALDGRRLPLAEALEAVTGLFS